MSERPERDAAPGSPLAVGEPERQLLVFCDQRNVSLCRSLPDGEAPSIQRFAWDSIRDVFFSGIGPGKVDLLHIFLDGEHAPILVPSSARGFDALILDLGKRGKAPRSVGEVVLWSTPDEVFAEPHAPAGTLEALAYPAAARWVPQLAAALPRSVRLAHVRRATTVAIYLQIHPIRMVFVDVSISDAILRQISDIQSARAVDCRVVAIDSLRSAARSRELLNSRLVRRIVRLPLRARVLEAMTASVTGATPSGNPSLRRPVLVVSTDPLLAERLRDELEGYRTVLTSTDAQGAERTVREQWVEIVLMDITLPDELMAGISALRSRRGGGAFRILGVRLHEDPFRASRVLAQKWVDRIIDASFDPKKLASLGLGPLPP